MKATADQPHVAVARARGSGAAGVPARSCSTVLGLARRGVQLGSRVSDVGLASRAGARGGRPARARPARPAAARAMTSSASSSAAAAQPVGVGRDLGQRRPRPGPARSDGARSRPRGAQPLERVQGPPAAGQRARQAPVALHARLRCDSAASSTRVNRLVVNASGADAAPFTAYALAIVRRDPSSRSAVFAPFAVAPRQPLCSSAASRYASRGVEGNGPTKPRQPSERPRSRGKVPSPSDRVGLKDVTKRFAKPPSRDERRLST